MMRGHALALAAGMLRCTLLLSGETEPPKNPFGATITAPAGREARVLLSDGSVLPSAVVRFRKDLKVLVFVAETGERQEVRFSEIVLLRQSVLEESVEREWRWKEGGSDEKIYTGQSYPWRKYGVEIQTRDGLLLKGRFTSGFPVTIHWDSGPRLRREAEVGLGVAEAALRDAEEEGTGGGYENLQEAVASAQKRCRSLTDGHPRPVKQTFIIRPRQKGGLGVSLDALSYIQEMDLREPGSDGRVASAEEAQERSEAPVTPLDKGE